MHVNIMIAHSGGSYDLTMVNVEGRVTDEEIVITLEMSLDIKIDFKKFTSLQC